jgi:hypothetical protein
MIFSSRLFGKGCLRPAVAELVPDRALMIRTKPFLLRSISPHHPAVHGFIELARSDHSLTNPVKKRPAWDVKLSGQFGWPPFIRQEPLMVPNPRAWRFHP